MYLSGQPLRWQALRKTGYVVALVGAVLAGGVVYAKGPVPGEVPLTALPAEAQATYQLIGEGGPFPYAKDGSVFGNRERSLPSHPRGYYREYTVPTRGIQNRGARRIVCGGAEARAPKACYYTGDHYSTFRRIAP